MPVTAIQGGPPGYFTHILITTPIAFARLKTILYIEFSRIPNGFLFVLLDPGGGLASETATLLEVKRPLRSTYLFQKRNGYKFIRASVIFND